MPAPSQFRLSPSTLDALDALAASAGTRSDAVRECIHYWHSVVATAARLNADSLDRSEWERLGHTGDPTPIGLDSEYVIDWSRRLAVELVGVYEGKPIALPEHKAGAKANAALARKIGGWGVVRGYALMAAVRYLWSHEGVGDGAWWEPEVWLQAEVRADAAT